MLYAMEEDARYSKGQHWKQSPRLFFDLVAIESMSSTLCLYTGDWWTIPTAKAAQEERERHWGTLANKAFAVQDRIMWKGLQMIAIWKMASEQLGQLMLPISHVPHLLLWSAMRNERQTAEEWNFETWVLPGSERWLAPGAQLQGTKELANVDPHLAPQLHHVRNQVHQSWPTFVAWKFWSQHPSGWFFSFQFCLRKPRHRLELRKNFLCSSTQASTPNSVINMILADTW